MTANSKRLTVDCLADTKRLPAEFLRGLGVAEGARGVTIPYGRGCRQRVRSAVSARNGSRWAPGDAPIVAYGPLLDTDEVDLRSDRRVVIVEGESDCWVLWHHGYAAIGLPGAKATNVLNWEHIESFESILVVAESDTAGQRFPSAVAHRIGELLAERHFAGDPVPAPSVSVVVMPGGPLGDTADIHTLSPDAFVAVFDALCESAKEAKVPVPEGTLFASFADRQWPTLDNAALYGPIGNVVEEIAPDTEADTPALLVDVLTSFGNVIGSGPHLVRDGAKHPGRLFMVLVGKTSRGRKGTARKRISNVMANAAPDWAQRYIVGGLASGEGLIHELAEVPMDGDDGWFRPVDPRRLVVEPEFARVLAISKREGNIVSAVLRQAWDGDDLHNLTKNEPMKVKGGHVSLIAHITEEELNYAMPTTEIANGFANRHLWVMTRRARKLPHGGTLDASDDLVFGSQLAAAVERARGIEEMALTDEAAALWVTFYMSLPDPPGLFGAITARAEAQVVRLAVIYAAADGSTEIDTNHLRAALAVWNYCEDSARWLFGTTVGNKAADAFLRELAKKAKDAEGMSLTEQHALFGRHKSAQQLDETREMVAEFLRHKNLDLVEDVVDTGGRPETQHRITWTWTSSGPEQRASGARS